jgi:serine protease Do
MIRKIRRQGFAIPISDALPVIKQIIEKGYVSHPALQVNIDDRIPKNTQAIRAGRQAAIYPKCSWAGG